jgi:DNA-binding transcriptional LysR family regulator
MISRRIAQLESELGVTLLKRTTRQLQLTPEGELFWQHAQRIQQELDSARALIQTLADKPKGDIRISAPVFMGTRFLMPIILKFMEAFPDIRVDLLLSDEKVDPVKERYDLLIRGVGFLDSSSLKDSSMRMKSLLNLKIGLYASADYLCKYGEPQTPESLTQHLIISYMRHPEHENWTYKHKNKSSSVSVQSRFSCNDTESRLAACVAGYGIARLTEMASKDAVQQQKLRQVLTQYDWGEFNVYAIYAQQQSLPKRTRLLLDFIIANIS